MASLKAFFPLLLVAVIFAKEQYVSIQGQLFCSDGTPATGALLYLKERDLFDKDDLLATTQADICGNFTIAGQHSEIFSIEPYIEVKAFCYIEKKGFCIENFQFKIPSGYVSKDPSKIPLYEFDRNMTREHVTAHECTPAETQGGFLENQAILKNQFLNMCYTSSTATQEPATTTSRTQETTTTQQTTAADVEKPQTISSTSAVPESTRTTTWPNRAARSDDSSYIEEEE